MIDPRVRLLRAAVGFAGLSMASYDRALWALRTWLNSWSGIGRVAVGMHRLLRVWALVLVCGVACASPATTTRDAPVVSEEPPPRFAADPANQATGDASGIPDGARRRGSSSESGSRGRSRCGARSGA